MLQTRAPRIVAPSAIVLRVGRPAVVSINIDDFEPRSTKTHLRCALHVPHPATTVSLNVRAGFLRLFPDRIVATEQHTHGQSFNSHLDFLVRDLFSLLIACSSLHTGAVFGLAIRAESAHHLGDAPVSVVAAAVSQRHRLARSGPTANGLGNTAVLCACSHLHLLDSVGVCNGVLSVAVGHGVTAWHGIFCVTVSQKNERACTQEMILVDLDGERRSGWAVGCFSLPRSSSTFRVRVVIVIPTHSASFVCSFLVAPPKTACCTQTRCATESCRRTPRRPTHTNRTGPAGDRAAATATTADDSCLLCHLHQLTIGWTLWHARLRPFLSRGLYSQVAPPATNLSDLPTTRRTPRWQDSRITTISMS